MSTIDLTPGQRAHLVARHTEDVDLHSVNYLHYGAPKSWYCIPPAHRARFELLVKGLLPDMFRACPQFMRHKVRPASIQTNLAAALQLFCCGAQSARVNESADPHWVMTMGSLMLQEPQCAAIGPSSVGPGALVHPQPP